MSGVSRRAFLAAAALAGCARKAQGFPGYAFVANPDRRSVSAVELRGFTFARQIAVDGSPRAVIAHPSRAAVLVLTPENGTLCEIDAVTLSVKRRAHPVQSAVTMRLAGDGNSLWLLGREPRALVRVPLDTLRPAGRISLPADPGDFELDRRPEGRMAGVSFPNERRVGLFDLGAKSMAGAIAAGAQPRVAGFRSDGKHLLVASGADRTMTIVDVATRGTVVKLPLPLEPANFCVTPDGGQLFVTGSGMDAVVIVEPFQTQVGETILAGRAPANMAVSNAPSYLFVSNPGSGDVTVIDIETRKVVVVVHTGGEPRQILFTPDNQYALVLNAQSADVAVIRISAFTSGPNADWAQRNKFGGLFTVVPVGGRAVAGAVVRVG
jgi:YVTN family beta-propeller protein